MCIRDSYKPDAEIRPLPGTFVGSGEYGSLKQEVSQKLGRRTKSVSFQVRVTNRGDVVDRMLVLGAPTTKAFKVAYFAGSKNVTAEVVAGTYSTDSLKPGADVVLTVKITRVRHAKKGSRGAFQIRATSTHEEISLDAVTARVSIGG